MISNKKIAVWFSCGAASAVAAKKTLEIYGGDNEVIILNNPVKEEHEDNQRFLGDIQNWLGVEIVRCVNPDYPDYSCQSVWESRGFMSGPRGAPCTTQLKKRARQGWEEVNKPDFTVLGFTAEETKRAYNFRLFERETLLTPLIDLGITKQVCFDIINNAGIKLPQIYSMGFPNANCIGCVKATSATYWNLVREKFPDVFEERANTSKAIGAKLVRYKGKRLFLSDLPSDAVGRGLKNYNFECGLFCEEKPK